MRRTINEPDQFVNAKRHHKEHSSPLRELFKHHFKTILYVITIDLTLAIGFYLIVTFINNFLTTFLKIDMVTSLAITTFSMVAMGVSILLSGWLSDKIGRKPLLISSALAFTCFAYPLFTCLESGLMSALFAHVCLSFIMGIFFAPIPATLVELFPLTVRYSGISISHSISMAVFGGTAPFIATGIIHLTHNNASPALYLSLGAFISAIALLFMKDRYQEEI